MGYIRDWLFKLYTKYLLKYFGDEIGINKGKRERVYYRLGKVVNFELLLKSDITILVERIAKSYQQDALGDGARSREKERVFLSGRIHQLQIMLANIEGIRKLQKKGDLEKQVIVEENLEDDNN